MFNLMFNIFNIAMDVKNKKKDNQKARMDVAELCVRGDFKLVQLQNGKLAKP